MATTNKAIIEACKAENGLPVNYPPVYIWGMVKTGLQSPQR